MVYLMSDIHGDYHTYKKILRKINFTQADQMYILGDVMDKGKENLRLFTSVCKKDNVTLMKGNHEYLCERYLDGSIGGNLWDACGGRETRLEVDRLTEKEKAELLYELKQLPIYKIVIVNGKEYFLTHSGLNADYVIKDTQSNVVKMEASVQKAVKEDQERYLFSDDLHYIPAGMKFDLQIVVGHYPTLSLADWERPQIYRCRRYICIDTGNERRQDGGRLACLRLEDSKEFYA